MRAYFFTNLYLSSIQNGIQSAHVIADMFIKYRAKKNSIKDSTKYSDFISDQLLLLEHWAESHKTMILLNGGYSENIRALSEFFQSKSNPYPWCTFHEGRDALDGALTNVGIILPEKIYETARMFRQFKYLKNVAKDNSVNYKNGCPETLIKASHSLHIKPNNIWGIKTDNDLIWMYDDWEIELCEKLNEFGLAR